MTYRLFLLDPSVTMDALINEATEPSYPVAEVNYDNITAGAYAAALSGQTVMFGAVSHADDLYGRQRLRLDSDSGKIYISRSSHGTRDGEVHIENNGYIRVYHDYRVWFTPGYIDDNGVIYKDHNIGFEANTRPVSNIGVGTAADIDSTSGVLRVQHPHTAQTSFATMPGASISSYEWGLPSGANLVAGYNLTDAVIQVDYDPGFYWISLEVTDSNGQTHKSRCPVYARDPANDLCIQNFEILSHEITADGQRMSIRVLDDIDKDDYPDGSLVLLWDDAQIGGVTSRTHMKFIGWHHTDPATITATRTGYVREVVLDCVDVAGRLAMLPGFPQHLEHAASPSTWYQMNEPNIDRMLHYLLDRHTTALELADFTWSGTDDTYEFVVRGLDGSSYWDQMNRLCTGVAPDYRITCNRFGRLQVKVYPMLQDSGDRTATVQDIIGADDFESVSYTHQRPPRYHWTRGDGIVASTTAIAALFSVAPGGTPGQGLMAQPKGEQLIIDQTNLNSVTGHYYAMINAPETLFRIRLARKDTVGLEPADMTWVKLDLVTPYAMQRDEQFTEARGLVERINITYESGPALVETVDLEWRRETSGYPAVTEILPDPPPPPPPPIPPPPPPPPPPPGVGDGLGTVHVMVPDGIGRTDNLSAGVSATWIDTTGSVSGTLYDFILDPFAPGTTAYCLASSGVWKTTNVEDASVTWTNVLTSAAIISAHGGYAGPGMIECHIGDQDWVAFSFRRANNIHCFAYSSDGGSSWSYVDVATYGGTGSPSKISTVQHVVGGSKVIYYTASGIESGADWGNRLYKSTNGGASWSQVNAYSPGFALAGAYNPTVHAPYEGNESGNIVWWCTGTIGIATRVAVSTDGGSNFTEKDTAVFGHFRNQIETWTGNNQRVWYWETADTLNVSEDGGDTWDAKTDPGGTVSAGGGFPYNQNLFYAVSNTAIFYSEDGGDTWTDATNDYPHDLPDHGVPERAVIVPNWTSSSS